MKPLALLFSFSLLLTGLNSFSQYSWEEISTSPTSSHINACSFISEDEGWIACDAGEIWYTNDGGDSWVERNWSGGSFDVLDIQFHDGNQGWACTNYGIILRTDDGGETWDDADVGSWYDVEDLIMTGPDIGFAVGHHTSATTEQLWSTTDGGATWSEGISSPGYAALYGIDVSDDSDQIIVACGKNDLLGYSHDGGGNWEEAIVDWGGTTPPAPMGWEACHMVTANFGLAVGWEQHTAITADSGQTWVVQAGIGGGELNDVEAKGLSNFIVCGTYGFAWTEDAGTGWNEPSFTITSTMNGIAIIDDSHAYVVGDNGTIYRSPAAVSTDLIVQSYSGPTEICGDGDFPVAIEIKNQGTDPIYDATITVSDELSNVLLAYDWTGELGPDGVEFIDLGPIFITEDQTIEIKISGDEEITNNTFYQDLTYIFPVGLGVDQGLSVCEGKSIELNAFGGTSYEWYEASEVSDPLIHNPTVSPDETTTYHVGIMTLYCFGTFETTVEVDPDCNEQTTAFSPNGDGTNDLFELEIVNPNESNEFRVYNRWGEEVKFIRNYNNADISWNGKDNRDRILPAGTYYYTYISLDSDIKDKGWVSLLR